ncbi:hypothetical protein Areg01_32330 [Actinoplanes regularis]|nr:hypothetical protein Areg01_32330 [Actinoplanes regularis]
MVRWTADGGRVLGVSFFDRVPPPPARPAPPERPRPKWIKPETEVGGVVAAELLLAGSDRAVIGLRGITAYTNGFDVNLVAVLRQEDRDGRYFHLGFHRESPNEPPAPEFLRIGVQFADGGVATNLNEYALFDPMEEPAGPILTHDSGGGGGRRYEMRYWVWPLPPPGPVTFVCEWPAFGIPEARAEMDGQVIRDAAARAVVAWPGQE